MGHLKAQMAKPLTHKAGRWTALWCATGAACVSVALAVATTVHPSTAKESTNTPAVSVPPTIAPEAQTAVRFAPPLAEIIRLLESGVSTEVVKSYVQNSTTAYPISADEILALRARGVPPEIIVAMLKRTGELLSGAGPPGPVEPSPPVWAPPASASELPPAYPASPQTAYGPELPYSEGPYGYDPSYADSYPAYPYWNPSYPYYPYYSSWWWTAPGPYYSYRYPLYDRFHGGRRFVGASFAHTRWPDAYPNRLVTGPYWGANRGVAAAPRGAFQRPVQWSGAYPNRLVTGPNWGANRGFAGRTAAPAAMHMGRSR